MRRKEEEEEEKGRTGAWGRTGNGVQEGRGRRLQRRAGRHAQGRQAHVAQAIDEDEGDAGRGRGGDGPGRGNRRDAAGGGGVDGGGAIDLRHPLGVDCHCRLRRRRSLFPRSGVLPQDAGLYS